MKANERFAGSAQEAVALWLFISPRHSLLEIRPIKTYSNFFF